MRNRLFACTFLVSLFLYSSAFGITLCHDYTVWVLTHGAEDLHKSKVGDLRDRLQRMGYKRASYPAYTNWKEINSWLVDHDVIIIGNAHSGVFYKGILYNFTQKTSLQKAKLHKDPSLATTMNKGRKVIQAINGPTRVTEQFPYRNKSVEVWRKIGPDVQPKNAPCRGPADGEVGAWIQDSNGCYNIPRKRKKRTKFEDSQVNVKGEGMFDKPYGTTPGFKW